MTNFTDKYYTAFALKLMWANRKPFGVRTYYDYVTPP